MKGAQSLLTYGGVAQETRTTAEVTAAGAGYGALCTDDARSDGQPWVAGEALMDPANSLDGAAVNAVPRLLA